MTTLFSIVSPMYNAARYLDDYFACLEAQTIGLAELDIVLVDDGSTDDTLAKARDFEARYPGIVTVLTKENGGQASARNLGLTHARGDWVTFPDPDDVLPPDYFDNVASFMTSHEGRGAHMYSARMLMWFEADGSIKPTHALDYRFDAGTRRVNLERDPRMVQAHVTTGFFKRDLLEREAIRFRPELRLRFEDGHVVTRYLLLEPEPLVGLVASAEYHYRQRADNSSTIQSSAADPAKYVDTLEYGFLDLVRHPRVREHGLPRWAQLLLLYDQFWIFRSSQTAAIRQTPFPESMYASLRVLHPLWLAHVDEPTIVGFDLMPIPQWMRDAMLLLKRGGGHSIPFLGTVDRHRDLVQISYRYYSNRPEEDIRVGGERAEARFSKDYDLELLGRPIVTHRTLWICAGAPIELYLNGVLQRIVLQETGQAVYTIQRSLIDRRSGTRAVRNDPDALPQWLGAARKPIMLMRRKWRTMRDVGVVAGAKAWSTRPRTRLAMRSARLRDKFRNAWVLIDRDIDSNDSAEILYRWIVANRPEVNAWFVVRRGTADWVRLRREGFRLIPYGSPKFFALMGNAAHLASSHADRFISDAVPRRYGKPSYSFTFLQHGVIKGDISRWLNGKTISTFIVSTEEEFDYVSGPGPFKFSRREVRLCGLPRFDDLLERDTATASGERRLILIMPTWRDHLVGAMGPTSASRPQSEDFSDSLYMQSIGTLLRSRGLKDAAAEHDADIVFMPHPNMSVYLREFDVPPYVQVVSYEDQNVRDLIVRARVMVTDYSSIAFNMGYLHRPVIYFQFDADDYYRHHTERRGYFDYETHGFGPVTDTVDGTVAGVRAALEGSLPAHFVARAQSTFPVRDGENSRRVFDAMIASRKAIPLDIGVTAAPAERWDTDAA